MTKPPAKSARMARPTAKPQAIRVTAVHSSPDRAADPSPTHAVRAGSGPLGGAPGRPIVMGVLNVTPDSFSDGGRYLRFEDALTHAREMYEQGATIVDVGGESTRPGAERVDAETETARVVP